MKSFVTHLLLVVALAVLFTAANACLNRFDNTVHAAVVDRLHAAGLK
jgi:hypothetical protein